MMGWSGVTGAFFSDGVSRQLTRQGTEVCGILVSERAGGGEVGPQVVGDRFENEWTRAGG